MAPPSDDDRKTSSNGENSSQDAQTGGRSADQAPDVDEKAKETEKEPKKSIVQRAKELWAKTGLDQRTMMTMAK